MLIHSQDDLSFHPQSKLYLLYSVDFSSFWQLLFKDASSSLETSILAFRKNVGFHSFLPILRDNNSMLSLSSLFMQTPPEVSGSRKIVMSIMKTCDVSHLEVTLISVFSIKVILTTAFL